MRESRQKRKESDAPKKFSIEKEKKKRKGRDEMNIGKDGTDKERRQEDRV